MVSSKIDLTENRDFGVHDILSRLSLNTDLDDLILHIKSINSESKSYKELKELFEKYKIEQKNISIENIGNPTLICRLIENVS